jgi:hypothetical protein
MAAGDAPARCTPARASVDPSGRESPIAHQRNPCDPRLSVAVRERRTASSGPSSAGHLQASREPVVDNWLLPCAPIAIDATGMA